MTEKTDKQKAIFAAIAKLKDRLADDQALIDFLHQDVWQLTEELKAAIERAEKADALAEQWRLAAEEESWPYEWVIATQYKEQAEKAERELATQKERARVGRLHAMETKNNLLGVLDNAKEIAEEVVSILADDHHNSEACQFFGATGKDVGCLACIAQERLADIKSLSPKSIGEKKTESRLRKALALYANPDNWRFSHDKENNLLWITSLGPDYAIEILNEVSRESSEEKEKETVHHPGNGTLIIRRTQQ